MSVLPILDFRAPWWLLLALQPALVSLLQWRAGQRLSHYAEAAVRPWAIARQGGGASHISYTTWVIWALLAVAAAGPRLPMTTQEKAASHDFDIYLVLDVSASMRANDIGPTRLGRAKLEIYDLLRRLRGEHVALLAFAGTPALIAMPTDDSQALRYALGQLGPGLFDAPGSDLGGALSLVRHIATARSRPAAVVVFSDLESSLLSGGVGDRTRQAVRALRAIHVPFYGLEIASTSGAVVLSPQGSPLRYQGADVLSRPDTEGFRELLALTGGAVVAVADGDGDWQAIYDKGIAQLPGAARDVKKIAAWRELYAWFLAPALLLILTAHLPKRLPSVRVQAAVFAIVALGILFFPAPPLHAASLSSAYSAYQSKRYAAAQAAYREIPGFNGRMGEGAAAYRRADYVFAIQQYTQALRLSETNAQRADALFNLGNSLARAGQLRAAIDAYSDVLRYRPGDVASVKNLAVVTAAARTMPATNAESLGIPGRRGTALSDSNFSAIDDKPVFMDPGAPDRAPSTRESGQRATGARSAVQNLVSKSGARTKPPYEVAAKKLEMIRDRPQELQQAFIRRDAREFGSEIAMPPW